MRTKGRHSIAFFVNPDYSTVIDPKAFSNTNTGTGTAGAGVTAYQHLENRLKESFEWSNNQQ